MNPTKEPEYNEYEKNERTCLDKIKWNILKKIDFQLLVYDTTYVYR